jgi:flagella basal body P-ring formation protein FlgA
MKQMDGKKRTWLLAVWLLVVWGLSAPSGSMAAPLTDSVKIVVNQNSEVAGAHIELGEIARVQAPGFLGEMIRKIKLGNAPRPGKVKRLTGSRLISVIRSRQNLPRDIVIDAPENIYVRRRCQQISRSQVRAWVKTYLSRFFNGKPYDLLRLNFQTPKACPAGELELAAAPESGVDQRGNLTVFLDVMVNGIQEDRIRISGRIALYESVLCTTRRMKKGAPITAADVRPVKKNVFGLTGEGVTCMEQLQGKILTVTVAKGAPLKTGWLKRAPLIHKGEVVTLMARQPRILIVTSGISREDGYLDQVIRVENVESGKVVRGLVKKASTVEVIY